MSLSDALRTARPPEIVAAVTPTPKGWERGVSWQGTDGTVTTGPIDTEVNAAVWKELIADWGLDSDSVEIIDGSVKFKGWDSPIAGGNGRDGPASILFGTGSASGRSERRTHGRR
jgi:hypothetical protein